MKRILYFTGYRMVAQEWVGRKLTSSVYFEPDEQGLDLFTAYLSSLKHEPVRLLVDLIEEEFRQVKIPLLRGTDRREILDRNFAKFFRNSEYRHAVSQSVEKKQRKEERLLFMGLTNQYLLKPWLDIIDATRTPLSGIVSLPLISEGLVSHLKEENNCVILVSQQVPSNLRQSVFLNGKLILSRLVPIASFYQGDYATDVIRDVESTQRYLVSQRLIDRTDTISVNILCNKRHQEKLIVKCAESSYFDYTITNINDLIEREKIEVNEEQDFSSVLFCYQATRQTFINHYARAREKRYFYHYVGTLATKVAAVILLAVSTGFFATSAVKAMLYDQTVTEMAQIEQKYKTKFNQLSENRIDSTTSTTNMQDVVEAVHKIEKSYQIRPRDMMIVLSRHLSLFDSIRLRQLEWFVSNASDTPKALDVTWEQQRGARQRRGDQRRGSRGKTGLFEIAIIDGEFIDFDGNYRFALSAVDDLENALRSSGEFEEVIVIERPLDIEAEKQLSGDVSVNVRNTGVAEAGFSIRVVRKVNTDDA